MTDGYWQRPAETKKTFDAHLADTGEGPFLRTSDLGFLKHGHLFITGRLKDVIIEGRNLYPHDIELIAEQSHPAVRQGCPAAFVVDIDNHERLVVTVEIDRRYQSELRSADDSSGILP